MDDLVNVVIEIPFRSRNKYEISNGKVKLDRVLYSAMGYPCEYGMIENTLAKDGDPLDILVIATEASYPGCIVPARIIGYLDMVDNGKEDYKLISVVACDPRYDDIKSLDDISSFTLEEIKIFFENYKKLENVEVRVGEYHSCSEALKILKECEERYNEE